MLKKIIVLLIVLWGILPAAINMQVRETTGKTVFERNSTYEVYLQIIPDTATAVGAIGEIYLEYDPKVFITVNSFAQDYHVLPSSIWESEKITFNAAYATAGWRAIEYAKTDNNGVPTYWTINSLQNIFKLSLRVRPNAPTGNTSVRIIYLADNSRTKMINSAGSVIPLNISSLDLVVDLDRIAPTTVLNPNGGIFNYAPSTRLKPNEDAVVHSMVIGADNIWRTELVSENAWSSALPISGVADQVRNYTVYYYSEDLALDKTHNLENQRNVAFTVDMQKPVISNVLVPAQNVPIGSVAEVKFNLFDAVGIGARTVLIGGKSATYYSGSGNGTYTYRRQIDGTENPAGILSITVSDTAGNIATDNSKSVYLDFGPPYFYDISTNPPTPQINQEVVISFAASEALQANPSVIVGENPANYISNDLLNYKYSYVVTGNGWYIDLGFIGDTIEPFTERNLAPQNSTDRPINTSIYFRIGDNRVYVDTPNMVIKINDLPIYSSGQFINGFTGRIFDMDDKPNVLCIPPADYADFSLVTVNIVVQDFSANTLNQIYWFQVGDLQDVSPSVFENEYPKRDSKNTLPSDPLYFELNDQNLCGVAIDRVTAYLNYPQNRNTQAEAAEVLDQDYVAQYITVREPMIINGIFQSGYSGTLVPDAVGNLAVTIVRDQPFPAGITLNAEISFEDIARIPNVGFVSWNFTMLATGGGVIPSDRPPLAWPTIYDPTNELGTKQLLTFVLNEPKSVTIRMYDLSGDMIWTQEVAANTSAYQTVPWDGRDGRGKLVGNGPYIWYIIDNQNKKVLGRGTSVIMK